MECGSLLFWASKNDPESTVYGLNKIDVQIFKSGYQSAQQSADQKSSTTFSPSVSDDEIKNLYEPCKKDLETKLSTHNFTKTFQGKK